MRTFNLVKSLTRVINNRKGLLILCLSLAVFGVNEVWGAWSGSGQGELHDGVWYAAYDQSLTAEYNMWDGGAKGPQYSNNIELSAPGATFTYVGNKNDASKNHYITPQWSATGASNDWSDGTSVTVNKNTSANGSGTVAVDAKYFRIKRTAESAGTKDVKASSIKITMAQYLENPSVTSLDCGSGIVGSASTSNTVTVAWCNVPGMTYTITGTNANLFTVSLNVNAEYGKYNTSTFTVTYEHSTVGEHSATLTISDSYNGYSKTVTLSGVTTRKTAEISWGQGTNLMNVDEYLENPASSTNGTLDVKYTSSDPSVIEVLEGSVLHALKYSATPVTVTAYQEESGDWARVEKQQTITVTNKQKQSIDWTEKLSFEYSGTPYTYQLSASASSSITYSIATDGGSIASVSGNTLTIKGIGKTTITATAAETDDYVGVSATRRLTVRDPNAACDEPIYEHSNTETLTAPAPGKTWETGILSQEPRLIHFDACKTGIWNTAIGDGIIVEEYVNGWSQVRHIKVGELKDDDQYLPFELPLSRGATKVRFKTTTGSYNRKFKNIEIYPAQYLESATTELNFTAEAGAKAPQQTFYINYSNIQGPISISCTDTKGIFSFPDEIDAECGDVAKNVPVTVDMLAQSSGSVSETLTLTDKKGQTISVTLKATVSKLKQSIEWDDETNYKTTDSPVLTAKSSTLRDDMPVTYRSGDETIAQVNGSKVTFLKAGDVTIYANQAGNTYYEAAPEVSKVFHVSKVTPTIVTLPTVGNAITYGSPLSAVALAGGAAKDDKGNAVTGHFVWTSPDEVPHGGQQKYTVRFVPDNTNMYTSDAVSTETLAITINKANQTLTWEVEDPIKIKKEDGNYTLTASSTSGRAITYTLSDPTLGTINGNILTPLKSGNCKITAICLADDDYNESNSIEKNLLIAGPDEIVWKYKNGDRVWAGQNLNADGKLATAHTMVWFGRDETQGYLTVDNNTDPKTVYTAKASDDVLVTISATTAGDDYYARVESSIQVYIDRCYQGMNWDQSFVSYTATAEGQISETIPLTAEAVDSLNNPTNLPIIYSVDNTAVAEITGNATDGWKLHIKGAGTATLTATVAQTDIYQGVSETRKINVRKEGEPCGSYALISTGEKKISDISDNTYTFNVPGETLTFKTRKYVAITLNANVTVEGWNIVNQAWEHIDKYNLSFTDKQTKTYTINENIRKIRMYTDATLENGYRYISDLYITQKEYIRPSVTEINENIFINQDFSKTFTVDYSDKPYINCSVNNDQLEIIRTGKDNDCGTYGTLTFTIKNKEVWDTPREYNATITLTTSVGDNIQIPVQIKVDLGATYKFTNAAGDGDWNNVKNWDYGGTTPSSLPQMINPVDIQKPVRVSSNVEVYGLNVQNDAQQGWNGSITIAPTGGLTVYNNGVAGLNDKLTIESTQENTGFFRVAPSAVNKWAAMPEATVQYATKGTLDSGANKDATWQYFGVTANGVKFTADYITWLYDWDETQGWVNLKDDQEHELIPFHGYAITQYGQPIYDFHGQLLMNNVEITLTKTSSGMDGENMIANSFPAPIDAKRFDASDFVVENIQDLDFTFYLFNSGSWNDWNTGTSQGSDLKGNTPGTFTAIPLLSSVETGAQSLVAPGQGICIRTYKNGTKIKLNYEKHVWYASSSAGDNMNAGLKAPHYDASDEDILGDNDVAIAEIERDQRIRDSIAQADKRRIDALRHRVRLDVYGSNSGADHLFVLEKDDYTTAYDNGCDAPKMFADGLANIYANEVDGLMAVAATNDVDGMFIGFSAGEDVNYELYVSSVIGEGLELMDLQTGDVIDIKEGATYSFMATPNYEDDYRFRIFKTNETPDTPTGWMGLVGKTKIWYNKQVLYIADANANSVASIYTADGKLLKQVTFNHNTTISTTDMPEGVYTVRVEGSVLKFFVKH